MMDDLVSRLRARAEREDFYYPHAGDILTEAADAIEELSKRPEIPTTGIGDLSDGYHTFNGLYYQRMALFAALVNAHQNRAWKSWKHEDGKPCFDGGWFIVGIDTPQGSYTYHYEDKYWDWFECEELPAGKHWDGHTEEDVIRLLSLQNPPKADRPTGKWIEFDSDEDKYDVIKCPCCKHMFTVDSYHWTDIGFVKDDFKYCPNCGCRMMEVEHDG